MLHDSILLVDDDEKLVKLLKSYFEKENFLVYCAYDGHSAVQTARERHPDIIVLDLMLPGISGWDVCRTLRKHSDIPILMLTARDEESDRLVGLEIGADDYVTKPFSPKEVVARVKAILRRSRKTAQSTETLRVGALVVDRDQHKVTLGQSVIDLTPLEFKIVELLAVNPGKVYTRLQLVEQVQGDSFDGYERTIDAHVKNIRRKIELNPREPKYILTVYGIGYKLGGE